MNAAAIAEDPLFGKPYIDVDQWRDTPVRHRYIHGGFEGADTRFSFYFPPTDRYEGRFFQHITPVPDSENLGPKMPAGEYNKIGFSIGSGAYFVETNGGGRVDFSTPGGTKDDPTITGYRANAAAAQLKAGDKVRVDNSNFLAAQTYHRHQVPGPDFPVWDQFRGPDGKPFYPQRPMLIGPLFVQATSGSQMTGDFEGKMIVVASLWDREAMPWQADWYRQRVAAHFGDKVDDHFRLYYTDHALHGDEPNLEDPSRIVPYQGMLQEALRDLAAWVEKGVRPPPSTNYRIIDGQVIVPDSADERRGLQPVVHLTVDGGERAEVTVGQPVMFAGTISVPPGAGAVVAAEWDFDGKGSYPASSPVPEGANRVAVSVTQAFDKPGTYFVALRGASQRQGDPDTPYARIRNLDRVRVIVR